MLFSPSHGRGVFLYFFGQVLVQMEYTEKGGHIYKCDFFLGGVGVAGKVKNLFCLFLAAVLVIVAGACLWTRVCAHSVSTQKVMLAAAALTLPDGRVGEYKTIDNTEKKNTSDNSLKSLPGILRVSG